MNINHKHKALVFGLLCLLGGTNSQSVQFVDLVVGDYDGDGLADFVRRELVSRDRSTIAEVYFGDNSQGRFINEELDDNFNLNADLTSIYVGDFNGDGLDDILRQEKGAWDDDSANTAYLLLAKPNGDFNKIVLDESYDLKGDLTNLYIGDFNGDGKDDVLRQEKGAWDDDNANTAYLLISNGDGTFQKTVLDESYDLKGDLTNLYIGDFNGDGNDDILRQEKGAWDDDNANTAYLLLSNGINSFTKLVLSEDYALKGDFTNLYIGDFNGDGQADVLRQEKAAWATDSVETASLLLSTATEGKFRKVNLPEDYALNGDLTTLYIGDFNGDGKSDFIRQEKGVWDDDNVNTAQLFISNGKASFNKIELPESWNIKGDKTNLYVGDFNGDGRDDFLSQIKGAWAYGNSKPVQIFLAKAGKGGFAKANSF